MAPRLSSVQSWRLSSVPALNSQSFCQGTVEVVCSLVFVVLLCLSGSMCNWFVALGLYTCASVFACVMFVPLFRCLVCWAWSCCDDRWAYTCLGLELDGLWGPFQPKPCYDSMTLWLYDSMILWLYDSMILWPYDSMIPWFHDSITYSLSPGIYRQRDGPMLTALSTVLSELGTGWPGRWVREDVSLPVYVFWKAPCYPALLYCLSPFWSCSFHLQHLTTHSMYELSNVEWDKGWM